MAVISSGRWDWWNEYTEKDRVVDCANMLSDELKRWPTHEEVTEVWPEYTLQFIQEKFGSYDTVRAEARDKVYRKNQGYRVKESPEKITFTGEQLSIIAEIKERPQAEQKPIITPKPTKEAQTEKLAANREMPMSQIMRRNNPVKAPVVKATPVEKPTLAGRQVAVEPKKGARSGRKPTFSDEQLLMFLRQIVAANGGIVPTTARAQELLRKQQGAPSLATMTNRLGPITSWERRLKNAS